MQSIMAGYYDVTLPGRGGGDGGRGGGGGGDAYKMVNKMLNGAIR